jgi:AraC-like DNA-binding protein
MTSGAAARREDEWSRAYRVEALGPVDVLHARFVRHCYAPHVHDYFVVGLVERGVQAYAYRGARHVTPAGRIFLVNADEPHTGEAATREGYVYRTLYPTAELLARVAADVGRPAGVPFFDAAVIADPLLARLLSRFHRAVARRAPSLEVEARLLDAIVRVLTRHAGVRATARTGGERRAVRLAREHMHACYARDLSLAELAAHAGLSPYHFARTFAREIGVPPHLYLEGVRIQHARDRLDRGEDIAATALAVGYADQSHLTRRFKRFLGITPGQYARLSKIRQDPLPRIVAP